MAKRKSNELVRHYFISYLYQFGHDKRYGYCNVDVSNDEQLPTETLEIVKEEISTKQGIGKNQLVILAFNRVD